jgi:hypothetical protein
MATGEIFPSLLLVRALAAFVEDGPIGLDGGLEAGSDDLVALVHEGDVGARA